MERIKTVVLVVLVLLSIVLSFSLMAERAAPAEQVEEGEYDFGPIPEIRNVIRPGRTFVISSESRMWQTRTNSSLNDILTAALLELRLAVLESRDMWEYAELDSFVPQAGILYSFDYQISSELLAECLQNYSVADFPFAYIDKIFASTTDSSVMFYNSITGESWTLPINLAGNFYNWALSHSENYYSYAWKPLEASRHWRIQGGVYDLLSTEVMTVPLWQQTSENSDAILRSFYIDPDRTMMIREADDAVIYTDGSQALRIYPSGALEYSYGGPTGGSTSNEMDVLALGLEFVGNHGGWPSDIRLFNFDISHGKSSLGFVSHINGWPVCSGEAFITIEVEDGQVRHYGRNSIEAVPDSGREVTIFPLGHLLLDNRTEVSQWFSRNDVSISNLRLVLYQREFEFFPAWKITLARQVLFVDASEGTLIYNSEGSSLYGLE